jgi:hypothetical protein
MSDQDTIICTQEEREKRISFCMPCEFNQLKDIPKCTQCDCPISTITSFNFKTCPIGKW